MILPWSVRTPNLRKYQSNRTDITQRRTNAAHNASSTAQMPATSSAQPPRILPNQRIQTNPHTLRINIRIHPPRNEQIDTVLNARIAIRPADSLVPVFDRGPCFSKYHVSLDVKQWKEQRRKVCLRNLCTALRAARSLMLGGRLRSSGGRRADRRCRLLGGGRLGGCG